jgi:hypothetical protein
MLSAAAQRFADCVLASPDLQQQLKGAIAPPEVLALAQRAGCALTMADLQTLAQSAFQQWVSRLAGDLQTFFQQAQATPDLNRKLLACQTGLEVVQLAQSQNLQISEADLTQAAEVAAGIVGFSFEKLWFARLGLLP